MRITISKSDSSLDFPYQKRGSDRVLWGNSFDRTIVWRNPIGEKAQEALKLQFDRRLRLEFHGARITSDAGLLACRELDGALWLTEAAAAYLRETHGGRNVQHQLVPLLRQSVYSRLAGYEDTNDAARLARDPAMQAVVGRRATS